MQPFVEMTKLPEIVGVTVVFVPVRFVTATRCALVPKPMFVAAKVSDVGFAWRRALPVPVRLTFCTIPPEDKVSVPV